jgi:hypothetical protein
MEPETWKIFHMFKTQLNELTQDLAAERETREVEKEKREKLEIRLTRADEQREKLEIRLTRADEQREKLEIRLTRADEQRKSDVETAKESQKRELERQKSLRKKEQEDAWEKSHTQSKKIEDLETELRQHETELKRIKRQLNEQEQQLACTITDVELDWVTAGVRYVYLFLPLFNLTSFELERRRVSFNQAAKLVGLRPGPTCPGIGINRQTPLCTSYLSQSF